MRGVMQPIATAIHIYADRVRREGVEPPTR